MSSNRPEPAKPLWSSRMGFILVATGSAVGLGNIWKFPYITGVHGGGAFVLVYLICIAAIGVPLLMAEVLIGKHSRTNPIVAYGELATAQGKSRHWNWVGWTGVTAALLVLSFYVVIAGWTLHYFGLSLANGFAGADRAAVAQAFSDLTSDPLLMGLYSSIFLGLALWIQSRGVRTGVERTARLLMPMLVVILLLLVVYNAMTSGLGDTATFMFAMDFSELTAEAVLIALGHAFFTLGLAAGAMLIFGSYLPANARIPGAALWVAGLDTGIALLAGFALFPVVFAAGLDGGQGPGLLFQTLPLAFGQLPAGAWLGAAFFLMLALAAFTSAVSMSEGGIAFVSSRFGCSRKKATLSLGVGVWLLSLGTVVSFNIGADWQFLPGRNFFQSLDHIVTNYMLPLAGLGLAIFAAWLLPGRTSAQVLNFRQGGLRFQLWLWLTRLIAPLTIVLVFLHALEIL